MRMELTAIYVQRREGGYTAFVGELPSVITQGNTLDEARTNLGDAVRQLIKSRRDEPHGANEIREPLIIDLPLWNVGRPITI